MIDPCYPGGHLEFGHHSNRACERRAAQLRPSSHARAVPHSKEQPTPADGQLLQGLQGFCGDLPQQGPWQCESGRPECVLVSLVDAACCFDHFFCGEKNSAQQKGVWAFGKYLELAGMQYQLWCVVVFQWFLLEKNTHLLLWKSWGDFLWLTGC